MPIDSKLNRIIAFVIVSVIMLVTPLWPVWCVLMVIAGIGWLKRRNARMGRH